MGRELREPIGGIVALDKAIDRSVAKLRKPPLLKAAELITILGSGPLFIAVSFVLLLICSESCRAIIYAALTAEIFELSLIISLRYLTKRERPQPQHGGRFFTDWNRYSFPSLHASRMFMLAIFIGAHWQFAAPYLLATAFVIGATRIFLGKHYLSDVIAGTGIGGLVATAVLSLNA